MPSKTSWKSAGRCLDALNNPAYLVYFISFYACIVLRAPFVSGRGLQSVWYMEAEGGWKHPEMQLLRMHG
jgi:hypothetical protein